MQLFYIRVQRDCRSHKTWLNSWMLWIRGRSTNTTSFKYLLVRESRALFISLFLSLSLSAYKKKSLVKSISPSSISRQAASENVVDWSNDPAKRFDHRTNDKSDSMSRAGAIIPLFFRTNCAFTPSERVFFYPSCRGDQDKNKRRKKIEYGAETGGKGVKKYRRNSYASSLWPSSKTRIVRIGFPPT